MIAVKWRLSFVTYPLFDTLFFYASVSLSVKLELVRVRIGLEDLAKKKNKQNKLGSISQMVHSYAEIQI